MNLDRWLEAGAHDLAELARLADGTDEALDELLRRGLDWLARVAPYDLAVVFELEGEELRARTARGPLASPEVRRHHLSLEAFPSIRQALTELRARVFVEDDHAHGEGDPFDGVLDFPAGHSCMVVPLVAGSEPFGVLSLDRRECVAYPQAVVDLAEVFGRLLALTIRCVRQGQELARARLGDGERLLALDRRVHELTEGAGVLASSRNGRVRELARQAQLVAATGSTVLLVGETGTGKERLARFLHEASPRAARPFVPVNCAALPAGLIESELFGHEKGSFSGATRARPGLFRAADGGTLFLDEIGELPLDVQAKLLRVLQQGEVQAVGADRSTPVNVRIVAATHVDLEAEVARGRFREDLFFRLNVFPLRLVPLRERKEDLPQLCEALLAEMGPRVGKPGLRIVPEAIVAFERLDFPGNIRQLGNLLEQAAIRAPGSVLRPEDVAPGLLVSQGRSLATALGAPAAVAVEGLVTLAEHERRYLAEVLRAVGGRIYGPGGAAEILGLPPSTLQSRMKKLGVARVAD
ncbi:MAG: GAF domain-containing protein [Myxococcales bacterium]|nr:MAG: GAF domain-containing protein [Myxococcales bacterium]